MRFHRHTPPWHQYNMGDEFREGNIPAGSSAVEFLEACHRMIPQGKRTAYYRSDRVAYQARVINWCFEHKVLFTITALEGKAVKEAIKTIREEEWEPYQKDVVLP